VDTNGYIGWEGNRRSGVALAMRHRLSAIIIIIIIIVIIIKNICKAPKSKLVTKRWTVPKQTWFQLLSELSVADVLAS